MRRMTSRYDLLLGLLGLLGKALFIGLFACTVLVVLAALLGFGTPALLAYQWGWGFFWRSCLALMVVTGVVALLDSLQ